MTGAVFLDRDGVLVRHLTERGPRTTPLRPEEVELLEGVRESLIRLSDAGYRLVVVTNQPDVAKGKVTRETMREIEKQFNLQIGSATVVSYYACYHHPDATQVVVPELLRECNCRKPKPGLILRATSELGIDLSRSWLVGDQPTDIEAGIAAGIPLTHLIMIGQPKMNQNVTDVADLSGAVDIILA